MDFKGFRRRSCIRRLASLEGSSRASELIPSKGRHLAGRTIESMRYVAAALAVSACVFAQTSKRPFDAEAMMRIARVSEPQLSPDGTLVAFTVERPDVNANTKPKQIYVRPGGRRDNPWH